MKDIPHGVRNNNPGNLEKSPPQPWQGLSAAQNDPIFYQFDDAIYGIRAIARQLIAYQDKHDCKTVLDSISRFAPPGDNNPTGVYAANVARAIASAADKIVDPSTTAVDWHDYQYLRPALEAIITQENGGIWSIWYTDAQLTKACVLAGVEPKKKNLMTSAQVLGSGAAAAATAAQPVIETVKSQLMPLTDYSDYIKHIFVGVALIGAIIAVIAKIDERNKGIS